MLSLQSMHRHQLLLLQQLHHQQHRPRDRLFYGYTQLAQLDMPEPDEVESALATLERATSLLPLSATTDAKSLRALTRPLEDSC